MTSKYTRKIYLSELPNGLFEVVDVMVFNSGNIEVVERFEGDEAEAEVKYKEILKRQNK